MQLAVTCPSVIEYRRFWTPEVNAERVEEVCLQRAAIGAITIEGRLAQAPQVFDNLTELVVLTNRRTQDPESGEWSNSDTTRYTVKTFKTLATRARDLESGEKVIVAGSIVTETWTDQTTQEPRHKQVLLADAIGRSV